MAKQTMISFYFRCSNFKNITAVEDILDNFAKVLSTFCTRVDSFQNVYLHTL